MYATGVIGLQVNSHHLSILPAKDGREMGTAATNHLKICTPPLGMPCADNNPPPRFEGHPGLQVEGFFGPTGVAFYSGPGTTMGFFLLVSLTLQNE